MTAFELYSLKTQVSSKSPIMIRLHIFLLLLLLCLISNLPQQARAEYLIESIAEGLNFPWSLEFLDDQEIIISELGGTLRHIDTEGNVSKPIPGSPTVYRAGQGGLFDVLRHPNFSENKQIYLSYASGDEEANATTVARAIWHKTGLTNLEVIFKATPSKYAALHYGGRLAWLPDNTLLLTTGDGFDFREKAQDRSTHFGKTIRMNENGGPARDNPFSEYPFIYSYGHRNPQGLAVSSKGTIYQHEHGPQGGDEVNIIASGKNYGWPIITYGLDYNGAYVSPFTEMEGMIQPVHVWTPSIAPSGLAIYEGDLFPEWQGDLFVGDLNNHHVKRLRLGGSATVITEETIFTEVNARVRDVRVSPKGEIYVVTDGENGAIFRVSPK